MNLQFKRNNWNNRFIKIFFEIGKLKGMIKK